MQARYANTQHAGHSYRNYYLSLRMLWGTEMTTLNEGQEKQIVRLVVECYGQNADIDWHMSLAKEVWFAALSSQAAISGEAVAYIPKKLLRVLTTDNPGQNGVIIYPVGNFIIDPVALYLHADSQEVEALQERLRMADLEQKIFLDRNAQLERENEDLKLQLSQRRDVGGVSGLLTYKPVGEGVMAFDPNGAYCYVKDALAMLKSSGPLEDGKQWCSYCRKTDHNDKECHSTRPADWVITPRPTDKTE